MGSEVIQFGNVRDSKILRQARGLVGMNVHLDLSGTRLITSVNKTRYYLKGIESQNNKTVLIFTLEGVSTEIPVPIEQILKITAAV
ncbi:hypothetical protein EPO56_02755 [Patescibacteria group bacterium]|nr:MAG: hypothetical protein EPO56_02755 [Patescibacteria group bacterium]